MNELNSSMVASRLMELAPDLMTRSAAIALKHYGNLGEVITKDDNSPLTMADLEVNALLCDVLEKEFPSIPVVTEERAESHDLDAGSGMFFLVDPIDGTKEFINKRDEFTVNVALIENRSPVAGIVGAPALGVYYLGIVGEVAQRVALDTGEVTPISVGEPEGDGLMVVASRSHLTPETQAFIDANPVAGTRNAGSSLKFCLLAAGEADVYPRYGPTMEWDTAAGHAVLLAAGGEVINLDGSPLEYAKKVFRNPFFIAASPHAHYVIPENA